MFLYTSTIHLLDVCSMDARRRDWDLPVLSEQITLTLPSASTDGSFLTIAFRFDILNTPSARVTVVTIGSPSGIAATASDTGASQHLISDIVG